jgi:5-methylcytosine-specific restriction endonuclease McrA
VKVKRRKRKSKGSQTSYSILNLATSELRYDNIIDAKTNSNSESIKKYSESGKPKLIVYINEFDKIDGLGNPQCRNSNCNNLVCKPFRKYCSRVCSKQFTKWYNANFYWRNIRNNVLKRDDYTCQLCGIRLHKRKKMNKGLKNWLECDHIIPKSFYKFLGYEFVTLEDKVKTIIEFVHNSNNLRTLCYKCHRKESNNLYYTRSNFIEPEKIKKDGCY